MAIGNLVLFVVRKWLFQQQIDESFMQNQLLILALDLVFVNGPFGMLFFQSFFKSALTLGVVWVDLRPAAPLISAVSPRSSFCTFDDAFLPDGVSILGMTLGVQTFSFAAFSSRSLTEAVFSVLGVATVAFGVLGVATADGTFVRCSAFSVCLRLWFFDGFDSFAIRTGACAAAAVAVGCFLTHLDGAIALTTNVLEFDFSRKLMNSLSFRIVRLRALQDTISRMLASACPVKGSLAHRARALASAWYPHH
jgi:hypothetical protein